MRKTMIALALALTLVPAAASAQSFEKKNYTYSEWTKGLFSEAVTVTLPGAKMIFLAGVGSEDEGATRGVIRHLGDFMGQCRYAYDKIKRVLHWQPTGLFQDLVREMVEAELSLIDSRPKN